MRYHGLFRPEHDFAYAERAVKAGLAGFELYGWVFQSPRELVERYKENVRRIREELQAGLSVHAPIIDINLGSINPEDQGTVHARGKGKSGVRQGGGARGGGCPRSAGPSGHAGGEMVPGNPNAPDARGSG